MNEVDCRYCSVVSKAVGEDPIGSAIAADQWLFIEVPRPWTKALWQDKSQLAPLLPLFGQIRRRPRLWQQLRIGAIASDSEYSRPGYSYILYYRRPSQRFAQFTAYVYCLPTAQVADLARVLLLHPMQLSAFNTYRQPASRDLLVCTHTHYDVACGRFGTPLYKILRQEYAGKLALSNPLRVWQTSHFGGHSFAPTLIDFPTGHFWGHLEPEVLDQLIYQRGDVLRLKPFYRGWGGCHRWGQIVERAIWMQEGWPWLAYPKAVHIVAKDPGRLSHRLLRWILCWIPTIGAQVLLKKLEQKLNWAQVRIQFSHPDGSTIGTYEARVEVSHTVMSQMRSGDGQVAYPVKQYRVIQIKNL